MEKPAGLGIFASTHRLSGGELALLVQNVERLGFGSFWFPEALSYECLSLAGYILSKTSELHIGTGIANIYARDAISSAQGHDTLNRLYRGRFILGLGVSHVSFVEGARGHSYGKPLATMRSYLENMACADIDEKIKINERNIVLAALGPKMLKLAGMQTKGALPYSVTPEHTACAREIMGPNAWLCVEQKICLTRHKSVAHSVAREQMGRYIKWENYRNNWFRLGFEEEDLAGHGSSRFLDAMVVWGGEKTIEACIDAHFRAGANQVLLQPFKPEGGLGPDFNALTAFAPNS
ncbi:MAG: LLM class F420-dependent oxidoreductase [Rhodospirillaceae bacterium]|nr:LLM class F420-dependent oxidoreductase [Rhodospirillaceae bacterium]